MVILAGRPRFEVADVVRAHGDAYRRVPRPSAAQAAVLTHIAACRTAALGGHLEQCDACAHQRLSQSSCRDRHCPKCQNTARAGRGNPRKSSTAPRSGDCTRQRWSWRQQRTRHLGSSHARVVMPLADTPHDASRQHRHLNEHPATGPISSIVFYISSLTRYSRGGAVPLPSCNEKRPEVHISPNDLCLRVRFFF